jgi:hypothetical protein
MSTDISQIAIAALVILITGYQIYVTVLLWRSDQHSRSQKWMQTILIWLLVLVGAILSHAVMRWVPKPRHSSPFSEPNSHDAGAGTAGAPPTVD